MQSILLHFFKVFKEKSVNGLKNYRNANVTANVCNKIIVDFRKPMLDLIFCLHYVVERIC